MKKIFRFLLVATVAVLFLESCGTMGGGALTTVVNNQSTGGGNNVSITGE